MVEKKQLSLANKVLIGLGAGLVLAFILQQMEPGFIRDTIFLNGILWVFGELFLNAIWFVVIPLIFVSLFMGVAGVSDATRIGRMGGKVVGFYLVTTAMAICLAMGFSYLLNPAGNVDFTAILQDGITMEGGQLVLEADEVAQGAIPAAARAGAPPMREVLIGIVPRNVFAAMTGGNTLQVIFVAVFFGLCAVWVGEKSKPLINVMSSLNEIVLKMVEIVMKFAPYGVFGLVARSFAVLPYTAILALIAFVGVVWLTLAVHAIVVYGAALKILVKENPKTGKKVSLMAVYRKMVPALTFAFASASSAATLPVTTKCADNLGVDRRVSSFALPLGVTINMDGTAIYQGVAAIFLASVLQVELGFQGVLTILITATLASIGTAGVPGAGMIMLSIVLASVGMPIEAIAIIFGIDRIVDMPRTVINICGDAICSFVVANSEGAVNWDQFNSMEAAVITSEAAV